MYKFLRQFSECVAHCRSYLIVEKKAEVETPEKVDEEGKESTETKDEEAKP